VREVGPTDGPVLVLLHGWTVTADLNWFASYAALAERYRVVALDHRGHGRGIRSRRSFRLTDCADDVVAVADALGIESFVPVGYSMGGPIALETWRRHRHRVDGLVLCATFASIPSAPRGRPRLQALGLLGHGIRAVPHPVRRAGFEQVLRQQTDGRALPPWIFDEVASGDPRALLQAGGEIGRFDARPWAGDIDVPTAVVVTARDSVVPPSRQHALAHAIPDAHHLTLDGDHDVCVMRAAHFLPTMLDACERVTLEAASERGSSLYSPP